MNQDQNSKNIQIRMNDEIARGVHGSDVLIARTQKEICLTFFVHTGPNEGIATARVFLPLTTALEMADIIKKQTEPGFSQYLSWINQLPPPSEDSTAADKKPDENV